jgi:hypothetical protein
MALVQLIIFAETRGDDFLQIKTHAQMFPDLHSKRKPRS